MVILSMENFTPRVIGMLGINCNDLIFVCAGGIHAHEEWEDQAECKYMPSNVLH